MSDNQYCSIAIRSAPTASQCCPKTIIATADKRASIIERLPRQPINDSIPLVSTQRTALRGMLAAALKLVILLAFLKCKTVETIIGNIIFTVQLLDINLVSTSAFLLHQNADCFPKCSYSTTQRCPQPKHVFTILMADCVKAVQYCCSSYTCGSSCCIMHIWVYGPKLCKRLGS